MNNILFRIQKEKNKKKKTIKKGLKIWRLFNVGGEAHARAKLGSGIAQRYTI